MKRLDKPQLPSTCSASNVVELQIDDLHPDPANPRYISQEQLEALTESIRRFGFVQPVLARRQDHVVIGGHQRLVAARRLGYRSVPVMLLGLSLEEARTLNLALNKISGEWDNELLGRLLDDLGAVEGLDLQLTGFSAQEIDDLIKGLDNREKRTREEDFDLAAALEAAQSSRRVERGQVWSLGPHRLLCGDACDGDDITLLMSGGKATMSFTDPPYNVALGDHGGRQRGQRRRRIQNDSLAPEEWERFVRAWAQNLIACVHGALYVCMSSRAWALLCRILEECGAHWSDTIIWSKDRFVLGRADYQHQYEPIWYGWPRGRRHGWYGGRDQGDVWQISRPADSELHPTMKPLELVERAVENSSKPGDSVCDLFLGSGTTLIACERTGRTCLAMEIDARYTEVAIARWEAFTGLEAQLIEGKHGV
jgi:DNA modification methylase